MRKIALLVGLALLLYLNSIFAEVVINEIMIDPVGADEGNEWIELYNNSLDPVSLHGWKIQSAGTRFTNNFVFPEFILAPFTFLLIAEKNIPNADFYANLSFQNGGSASDAIRLISQDESYTDTFVYDSPNSNDLPDDENDPAIEMFPSIETGKSVARGIDGYDSNSIDDWLIPNITTPGFSNTDFVDIEIASVSINTLANCVYLNTVIHNLSTIDVPASAICIEYIIDYNISDLQPVSLFDENNECVLFTNFDNLSTGIHNLKIIAHCHNDSYLGNNTFVGNFLIGESPILINEVMHSPNTGNPEWIELYNKSDSTIVLDDAVIIDLSGSKTKCIGEIGASEYKVLCPDKASLLLNYPHLVEEKVIQTTSWATLNNNGDGITLYLYGDVKVDSMSYSANSTPKGISLERHIVNNEIVWIKSISPYGASPGEANVNQQSGGDIIFEKVLISQNNDSLLHTLQLINNAQPCEIKIELYETQNHDAIQLIYEDVFYVIDELSIDINTGCNSNSYTFYGYHVSYEHNGNELLITQQNAWLDNKLPWVINEIMYNPNSGEPEWIEIKTNDYFAEIDSLYLYDSNSFVRLPALASEYIIIAPTRNDTIWLKNTYDLENVPIFYGLPNLSNQGEQLTFTDNYGNIIEQFTYQPSWSKEKGVSIERKFSNAIASEQNWGPSRNSHTIGAQNSLYISTPDSEQKVIISPQRFSPYRSEQCNISLYSTESDVTFKAIIFDINGNKIREITCGIYNDGYYTIIWDGKNKSGKSLLPGVYPIYLEAGKNGRNLLKKRDKIIIGY
ncbi:MAG TPA: lamin tail domain-containing protein [Candidatus Cloacimonadota bacterium]|nr:lamin tail domain-containing protein [Candidatus Cloacimonadota bacterium]HQB41286.1 lamin tail domain-containing protein [Candidatus Cloacimonadota bacterium]